MRGSVWRWKEGGGAEAADERIPFLVSLLVYQNSLLIKHRINKIVQFQLQTHHKLTTFRTF